MNVTDAKHWATLKSMGIPLFLDITANQSFYSNPSIIVSKKLFDKEKASAVLLDISDIEAKIHKKYQEIRGFWLARNVDNLIAIFMLIISGFNIIVAIACCGRLIYANSDECFQNYYP